MSGSFKSVCRLACTALLALAAASCGGVVEVVGGQGVEGKYAAVVDLRPHALSQVSIDVYEDFTCPACQRFTLDVLPELKARYGNSLQVRKHYVAAPSTQPAAVILFSLAQASGREEEIAQALFEARLEHKNTPDNDAKVMQVAARFELEEELANALADPAKVGSVREDWSQVAHKVAHFPFVEVENEISTNGDPENLIKIINSLLKK